MKKFLTVALAGVLAASMLFTGCSKKEESKVPDKLIVGTNAEFPPFEYMNDKKQPDGFDIAMIKEIGKRMDKKVEIQNMEFKSLIGAMESNSINTIIAGMTKTKERQKSVDFSDSYYTSENVVIVKKDKVNDFTSADSLAKQTVGTQKGSVQETIAKKQLSKASVVSLASNGEMINELKSGQIQAVVLEKAIAEGYIAQNDDLTLASFNLKSDGSDAYAVAIRKGSDDLLKEINAVIKETKESGKFDQWLKEASSYKQSK